MMVASSVLMERGVEVALQVTRRREPLVTGFTLIRFDTFSLIRLIGAGPFQIGRTWNDYLA